MFNITLDKFAYHRRILSALQRPKMHVYGGTVPEEVVAARRARNKRARVARRINRKKA
ncbi:hypothetical protein [Rhodococcus rhodochrous]|uniref:hypothetical protein n=1 Tax=Rhodococcus rhodochrous TaxID=1829 RepID=UPI001782F274|nr:hypothetical protein [Rhodococcus rhodochrous]